VMPSTPQIEARWSIRKLSRLVRIDRRRITRAVDQHGLRSDNGGLNREAVEKLAAILGFQITFS
jgi:hypothetical protein